MKRLYQITALLLALVTLAGCVANQKKEAYVATGDAIVMSDEDLAAQEATVSTQDITLAYYPDRSMNPLIAMNITNRVLFSLIYQGLFATDSDYNTYPILCSHYSVSSDDKTWTIYIESTATFSDGTRLTAQDVLATYEAAQASDYYGGRFTHVVSMELLGSDAIVFQLETPYQNFALQLDIPILKASEVDAEYPLGTGPYSFEQGTSSASLVRVSDWWCTADVPATAQTIALVEGSSQSQIRDEFEFGDVDLACANPMVDSYAEYQCDYELWKVDNGMFLYLGVNVLYSEYFKDDDSLRKVLTYAIDRDYINETYYNGLAQPSTLPTSPSSPYYNESLAAKYEFDDMKFVEAISSITLPKDEDTNETEKMLILVNCDDSARVRTARYLAEYLTDLGIPTGTLEYGGSTSPTYEQVLLAGTYDLYLGQTRLSPTLEMTSFYRGWGSLYYGGITDGTLYNMVKEALANSGNYYNLNQMVAEDGKVIPILFGTYCVYANRGEFSNLSPSRDNVFFYTLDKTMTSALLDE